MKTGPLEPDGAISLRAWIGLGSNMGDRAATIERALAAIDAHQFMRVRARSSLHETDPVGGPPGQGRYLNAAAEIEVAAGLGDASTTAFVKSATTSSAATTELQAGAARRVLQQLLEIERSLGRMRDPRERNAPRTIDLDLLLAEVAAPGTFTAAPLVLREPDLELPHPRLHERRFVLAPLAEIAPDLSHPRLGLTIAELLEQLQCRESSPGTPECS